MVTTADRTYFQRVGEALRRYDRACPPENLDAAIKATRELWTMAESLGHQLPDAEAQAAECAGHQRLFERHRALRRV